MVPELKEIQVGLYLIIIMIMIMIMIIIIIIIKAAFIMRTFPSRAYVQGATYYITPVVGYNFKTALTVHNFHSQGSIPCRAAYHGITGKCILNISFASYWVPILYTWVESSNVDKVSCWGTKVPGIDRNRTRNPLIQSQGFNPIWGTVIVLN